jgi:hypothetical protein
MSEEKAIATQEAIESQNVANILKKLQAGRVLSAPDKATLADWQAKQQEQIQLVAPTQATKEATPIVIEGLSSRQREFASLIAMGLSQTKAYEQVYQPRDTSARYLATHGYRIAQNPKVRAEIKRLQGRFELHRLLTREERLEILARDARSRGASPAYMNARARSLEVYTKIAGDGPAEKHVVQIVESFSQLLTSIDGGKVEKFAERVS